MRQRYSTRMEMVTLYIDRAKMARLRKLARGLHVPYAEFVRAAIDRYIDEMEKRGYDFVGGDDEQQ